MKRKHWHCSSLWWSCEETTKQGRISSHRAPHCQSLHTPDRKEPFSISFPFLNLQEKGCKGTCLSPLRCAYLLTHTHPALKPLGCTPLVVRPLKLQIRCKCHWINSLNTGLFSPFESHSLLGYASNRQFKTNLSTSPQTVGNSTKGEKKKSIVCCKCTVPQPENK